MALIKCPECNEEVSTFATTCPKCGYPISGEKSGSTGVKLHQLGKAISNFIRVFGKKK
jgi:predicted amidophosphoribosyltransferase